MCVCPKFALLAVILLAVLIGCKKRDKGTERTLEEIIGLKPGNEGVGNELFLPPAPATYPNTNGGQLAAR